MVDGESDQVWVQRSTNYGYGASQNMSMDQESVVSTTEVANCDSVLRRNTKATRKVKGLDSGADIVEEVDEDEGSLNLKAKHRSGRSEDDMASVSMAEYLTDSEGSETSVRKLEGPFTQMNKSHRKSSSIPRQQRSHRSRPLLNNKSFVSDAG